MPRLRETSNKSGEVEDCTRHDYGPAFRTSDQSNDWEYLLASANMMEGSDPTDIGDYVAKLFAERWRDHDRSVLRDTLLCMLAGQPVNSRSVSKISSIPESQVLAAFATDRYDLNSSGEVVEVFGVSTTTSRPFQFDTQGSTLNVCCALVSVMMSQLTPGQKSIVSIDPISRRPVKLISGPSGASSDPRDAVVALVAPPIDEFCRDPWNSFCKFVRFYESAENARAGPRDALPAVHLSVHELFGVAELLSGELWGE